MSAHSLPARERIFVALVPPIEISTRLVAWAGDALPPELRVYAARDLHLTLCFVGDSERERREELDAQLGRHLAGRARFHLRIAGSGAFPAPRSARALWAGVGADGAPGLAALHECVQQAAGATGWHATERDASRPFRPHITLARARTAPARADLERFLMTAPEFDWPVERVVLVCSTGDPAGRYVSLASYPLELP